MNDSDPNEIFPILRSKEQNWHYWFIHLVYFQCKARLCDVSFLRYWVQQTILCHFGPFFLSFYPINNPENKILQKRKNTWTYYYFIHMYHKRQSYDVWFLRYGVQQLELFVILDHFMLFYSPSQPEKLKKKQLEILSFYTCTKNNDHMMYGSWDVEQDVPEIFILF